MTLLIRDVHQRVTDEGHHFESAPPIVENANIAPPTGPGFNVILDPSKIDSQRTWNFN